MARTEITCIQCGCQFERPKSVGAFPSLCSIECKRERSKQNQKASPKRTCAINGCHSQTRAAKATLCNKHYSEARKAGLGICTVHKCLAPAVRVGVGLCEMHYGRMRRNHSLDLLPPNTVIAHSAGYVLARIPNHPLSRNKGRDRNWVYEHRAVAYAKYGPGPQHCHWCKKAIEWPRIEVDHLNGIKSDNRADNLVATCSPCNRARGAVSPFMKRLDPAMVADFIKSFGFDVP